MEPTLQQSGLLKGRGRAVVMVVVLLLMLVSWLGVIDRASTDYIDSSLVQASVAFGAAKLLNALISMLQSAEVEVSMVVFSGSLGLGEMLDPFNDLVEDFSSLMKLSIGSLLVQKVLLGIVSDVFFKVVLTLSGGMVILSLLRPSLAGFNQCARLFAFLLFLRFALVVVVALNGVVSEYFLAGQSDRSIAVLEALPGELEETEAQETDAATARDLAMQAEAARSEREIMLTARLTELAEQREQLTSKHAQATAELEELQDGMETVERINVFSRSPEHAKAIAQVDLFEEQLELLEDEQHKAQNGLAMIQSERQAAQNPDGASSLMDSVSGTFSKLTNPLALGALKDKLSDASDTIMEVMALFVLRTLILPLLFLYCLTVVFKTIWRVDARELLNRYMRDGKEAQHA
ncbi:hypothetical protein [Halopseudomonas aestusnigri]|jgi:hypothetical protein|uniref:hypothetical protein n=1 Tax=Halopseudomonas aestusnigri TaxID=857252 RepID=UPI000C57E52F|nr:hypothetical protein [Pseudomonadales bacterium]MAY07203.1 hypothetical protein [Pseudomonadales bacterium]|tara:strand:+ start:1995 stop:3212 length:1218 start_codon:yes stop_codon:yes gene_type:complete